MSFDLDAIISKKRYVTFKGKDIEIKDLTTKEYLEAQAKLGELQDESAIEGKTVKELTERAADIMVEYLMMVLDITKTDAKSMEYRQFRAVKDFLEEIDLLDQGFTKEEINSMRMRAVKNRVEQMGGS